jgi:rhomboid protease GluP
VTGTDRNELLADEDGDVSVPVIRETLLSRQPNPASSDVALVGVAVLTAVSAVYWIDPGGLAAALPASRESVFARDEYWRLLTSLGAHSDAQHLLANAALFGILAYLLHGYFGAVVFPLIATILGVLTTALTLSAYPARVQLVGASGMAYAMAGLWLSLYLVVERRLRLGKRVLRASGFGLIMLVPSVFEPHVSYRAHAIGFVLGVAAGLGFFLQQKHKLRAAERIEWD